MKTIFAIIGFVVVCLVIGTCAFCGDDNNDHRSLGRSSNESALLLDLAAYGPSSVASRYDEQPRCYEDEDCDGYDDGGDSYHHDYSNHDRNRNRHRNRGAFSPGPFDRSPVTIIICPPGTQYCGSDGGRGNDQQPPEERYV